MISVVIPVHNEEKAIGAVLDELIAVLEGQTYEIIVVDDGSTDKTAEIVQKKENVKFIQHPYNKGYGAALKTGIRNATNDLILIIDGDGSYPVKKIPEFFKEVDKYDMVIGARTGKEVKIQLYRKPAKWFLSKLANYLSGTKIPDLNSGMRLFKKQETMKFFNVLPSGFSFTTTLTLAYLCCDYNVKYVPIDYYVRAGKSKIKPFRDGFNFIMLIVRAITYFNPLKVFLPISIALFIMGFLYLIPIMIFYLNVPEASILLIISSILIFLFGLLADQISTLLRRDEVE